MKVIFVKKDVEEAIGAIVNMKVGEAMADARKQILAGLERDIKEVVDRRVAETFAYFASIITPEGLVVRPYDPPRESWEKLRNQVSDSIYNVVRIAAERKAVEFQRSTATSEDFIDSVVERINKKQVRGGK